MQARRAPLDDVEEHVFERRVHDAAATSTAMPCRSSRDAIAGRVRGAAAQHGVDGGAEDAGLLDVRHRVERRIASDRIGRPHFDDRPSLRIPALSSSTVPSAASSPGLDDRDPLTVLGLVEVMGRDQHGRHRPRRASSMSRQNWRRDSGSTPPVGSSRKTIGGSWRIAQPSASRCRQPPGERSRVSSRPLVRAGLPFPARSRAAPPAARRVSP